MSLVSVLTIFALSLSTKSFGAPPVSEILENQKVLPLQTIARDFVGAAVDIQGDLAVIGAPGAPADQTQGRAYVYARNVQGEWEQEYILTPSDPENGNQFGFSVAIDGDLIIVGAPLKDGPVFSGINNVHAGAVYVFRRDTQTTPISWTQDQKIRVLGDEINPPEMIRRFGEAVDYHPASEQLIVGAIGVGGSAKGRAFIYKINPNTNNFFLATGLVPAEGTGGDGFGRSVAIGGQWAMIGAPGDNLLETYGPPARSGAGSVYFYKKTTGVWDFDKKVALPNGGFISGSNFGFSVALEGTTAMIGVPGGGGGPTGTAANVGHVQVYGWDSTNGWNETQRMNSDQALQFSGFGRSVDLQGDRMIIGDTSGIAPRVGSFYLYKKFGGNWNVINEATGHDTADGDDFAGVRNVALDGRTVFVGAVQDENQFGTFAGAGYLFDLVCRGDCNGDGVINFSDNVCTLFAYGPTTPATEKADCDASGTVDFSDTVCILFSTGESCQD